MPDKIEQAFEEEIAAAQAELDSTPLGQKLTHLRKSLSTYRMGKVGGPVSVYVTGVSAGAELGNTSTRSRSPESQAILDKVWELLPPGGEPVPTRQIFSYLVAQGITVPGRSPANNLSAMLSNAKDMFKSNGRIGWTRAENENPADADSLAEESVNGDVEDLPHQQAEPGAQGRQAGPGGGT